MIARGLAAGLLAAAGLLGPMGKAVASCLPSGPSLKAALPQLTSRGELKLLDGRRGRLAGIRLFADQATALAPGLVTEEPLRIVETAPPDRWGRVTVMLLHGGQDIALWLLRSGLGAVDPASFPAGLPGHCLISYLQAEDAARRAARGAWPAQGPVDGGNSAAVAARAGQWAIVEGRIVSVGLTRRSVFLNFGSRGQGSSVVMGPPQWRELEARGWTRDRLRGLTVRARGVVDGTVPPRVLVETAAAIEVVE